MVNNIQNFIQTLARMQWSDYVDIFLVAFLIYTVLPLLSTPNVKKVTRTVVALVLIAWLTDVMDLHTINWLLSQLLAIGLLAFVILFQPELRSMLEHLSHVKLGKLFGTERPVQEREAIIAQTVKACESMSPQKVGALMVFSRNNRLDEYFKTGTVINGQVTEQLLRNIFVNKAPLHDGAVVIQDGKIAAAACILPVSNSTTLSKELGTRHRAAVGISEVSDAVAVVVSEESGDISVAIGGMLKRHLTLETLQKLLINELCPPVEDGRNKLEKLLDWISGKEERLKEVKDR